MQIRAEAQDLFNQTVYPTPVIYPEKSTFLNVTAGENNGSNNTARPRIIKVGAKFIF